MDLFIPDLYEVLKKRVKTLTDAKASDNPGDVLIRLKDVQSVCDEIKTKAELQAQEIEQLREESAEEA